MTLRIDKFGRILIPKAIRQAIGIDAGDELIIEIVPDKPAVKLTPKLQEPDVRIEYSNTGFPTIVGGAPYPDDFDFKNATKDGYEEYHKSRFGV